MSWPAKYFAVGCDPHMLVASINASFNGRSRLAEESGTDPSMAKGFQGLDYYYGFYYKGVAGTVMVSEGDDGQLWVVIYAVPAPLRRAKAVQVLEHIVSSVPGAVELEFPDGPRAGDLLFV